MSALVPVIIFALGIAVGGVVVWCAYRKAIEAAREQERAVCAADVRVAEANAATKDQSILELRGLVEQRDGAIEQRNQEILRLRQYIVQLQTTLKKEQEKIDEKIKLLGEAEKHFKDTFESLAAKALKENNVEFDKLAKPVRDALSDISGKIAVVNSSAKDLSSETSKLVKALQKPEVRGQWGEMHLLRVVEMTGMTDRCDFHEQQVIGDGEAVQRPDLIVHLPGDRHLAIDAKAPIRAFLDAAEANDEEARRASQDRFVAHIREHVRQLGSKSYYASMDGTPEFVVLYLPTEAIFSAALSLDADLLEFAAKHRVHLAGPTVLLTLLRAVAHGWKQESIARHAKEICALGEELYKRLATFGGHMAKLGGALNRSVSAYNQAVGSLESRVMPGARQFEQMGAAPADARIEELTQIETTTRELQSAEFEVESNDGLADAETVYLPR